MHIVACQTDIAWKDKAANRRRVLDLLDSETVPAGSLIVLPEMFESGFTMKLDVAVDADGSGLAFVKEIAAKYQSTVLAGVVTADSSGKGLNQAVAVSADGRELVRYTKMHPFTPAGESEHYQAGDTVNTFECGGFTVAPLICYDLRFPELAREAVLLGANVLIYIASWPAARAAHWSALLTARAIENQAYVVGVNRVGNDPKNDYPGLSCVIDPQGKQVASADNKPVALHADLDIDTLQAYRDALPFLKDMRSE